MRGRRVGAAGSRTPYPTSTASRFGSPPAGAALSGAAVAAIGAAGDAPAVPIVRIGAPTGDASPPATWIAVMTPAYGQGSSTAAFAVSISTMVWLTVDLVTDL